MRGEIVVVIRVDGSCKRLGALVCIYWRCIVVLGKELLKGLTRRWDEVPY